MPDVDILITSGLGATFLTTAGLVLIAIINNRRERKGSAEASMEATLRERLDYRDEKIEDLKKDKADLLEDKERLLDRQAELLEKIRELESTERRRSSEQ